MIVNCVVKLRGIGSAVENLIIGEIRNLYKKYPEVIANFNKQYPNGSPSTENDASGNPLRYTPKAASFGKAVEADVSDDEYYTASVR